MLASLQPKLWWYMEIPRTGSTSVDRGLRQLFPHAVAYYQKHWPCKPPLVLERAISLITIRNPFSRAVSCWQFFTLPGALEFSGWLQQRLENGFTEVNIEARPQAFWFGLQPWWDLVLQQERLEDDFCAAVKVLNPGVTFGGLPRFNDINGPWVNRCRARVTRDQPWQAYYNARSIELVRRLYAEDFDMLSDYYTKDLPS